MHVLMATMLTSVVLAAGSHSLRSQDHPRPTLFTLSASPGLGSLDVARPIRGSVYVMNTGGATRRVVPPQAKGISRVQIFYPKNLVIPPGGSLQIPWEYDGHGDKGPSTFKVQVQTDDPGAPTVEETYNYMATETTKVRPYRSCVVAKRTLDGVRSSILEWEFQGVPGEEFIGFVVEDTVAPLKGTFVKTPGGGLLGTLVVDGYLLEHGGRPNGETRVFGVTNQGARDYFWVQWVVR